MSELHSQLRVQRGLGCPDFDRALERAAHAMRWRSGSERHFVFTMIDAAHDEWVAAYQQLPTDVAATFLDLAS